MSDPKDDARKLLAGLRDVVKKAIWTLVALRDPDRQYMGGGTAWLLPVVRQWDEYNSSAPRVRQFNPTPADVSHMEIVAVWLAWLRREESESALRRIWAWALAVPTWKIAQREGCSEKTVLNRVDRSLNAILKHFGATDAEIEAIEEKVGTGRKSASPRQGRVGDGGPAFMSERPLMDDTLAGVRLRVLDLIYVDGVGLMKGGKRHRDGSEAVDRKKIA
jgi:hypothetical protein